MMSFNFDLCNLLRIKYVAYIIFRFKFSKSFQFSLSFSSLVRIQMSSWLLALHSLSLCRSKNDLCERNRALLAYKQWIFAERRSNERERKEECFPLASFACCRCESLPLLSSRYTRMSVKLCAANLPVPVFFDKNRFFQSQERVKG